MKTKYVVILLIMIAAIAYIVADLNLLKSVPSETDCLKVANNMVRADGNQNFVEILSLKKNNGYGNDGDGQEYYVAKTKITFRIIQECIWYPELGINVISDFERTWYNKPKQPGNIISIDHKFIFYKTEKGWEGQDNELY